MATFYIGTSGFEYKDWGPKFYGDIPQKEHLTFFGKHFKTLELNVTFYRLPPIKTFQNWQSKVPADFRFAVKLSRYITHRKRLLDSQEPWQNFLTNITELREKLGPILIQLPPRFAKNLARLKEFLQILQNTAPELLYAFEFRHDSWFDQEVIDLFKQSQLFFTLVIANSQKWPMIEQNIGHFVYIRMHGAIAVYSSKYPKRALQKVATKIKQYLAENLDVYVYFNNDVGGYAVDNAQTLLELLQPKGEFKLGDKDKNNYNKKLINNQ